MDFIGALNRWIFAKMASYDGGQFGHLSCQALDLISIDKFKNDIDTDSVKTKLQNLVERGDTPLYCQSMKTMFAAILFKAAKNSPEARYESKKILWEVLEDDKTNITSLADLIYIYEHIGDARQADDLKKRLMEIVNTNDLALARTYYDRAHVIRHYEQDKRDFTYSKCLEMSKYHIRKVNSCNEKIETEKAEIIFAYSLSLYRKYSQKTEFGLLEDTEIRRSDLLLEEAIDSFLDVVNIRASPGECTALSWIFVAILLRLKTSFDQYIGETTPYINKRLGDAGTVEGCLERGLTLAPEDANVLRRVALEYVHLNRMEEAMTYFKSSIDKEESWFAFHHQGELYLKMHDDTKDVDYLLKAKRSIEQARHIKGTHADFSDLGYIYLLQGEKKIAMERNDPKGIEDLEKAKLNFAAAVKLTDCDDYFNPIETYERWGRCLQLTDEDRGLTMVRQMSIDRQTLLARREEVDGAFFTAGDLTNSTGEQNMESTIIKALSLTTNEHDFYVVTSRDDREWVIGHLLPNLEDAFNLSGFFNERDKVLGENYISTIVKAIHSSRHIVIVLSPNFLSCNWCQYELSVALHNAVSRRLTVVPIMLQQCQIPETLELYRDRLITCVDSSIGTRGWQQLQQAFNKA